MLAAMTTATAGSLSFVFSVLGLFRFRPRYLRRASVAYQHKRGENANFKQAVHRYRAATFARKHLAA